MHGLVCWKENITHCKEEVTDVVRGVHRQSDIGEMEAIAEADQRQGNKVVANKLLEVFAWGFHPQQKHNGLLSPVGRLEQVVELEDGFVGGMREALIHASSVEVPNRCTVHDVHAPGPCAAKVDGRVHLFHETRLLALRAQASVTGQGSEELLHNELAGKGQDNGIERHQSNVPRALAILGGCVRCGVGGRWQLIAEKDEVGDGVGFGRVQRVETDEDRDEEGRQGPCVLDRVVGGSLGQAACLASLGLAFQAILGINSLESASQRLRLEPCLVPLRSEIVAADHSTKP